MDLIKAFQKIEKIVINNIDTYFDNFIKGTKSVELDIPIYNIDSIFELVKDTVKGSIATTIQNAIKQELELINESLSESEFENITASNLLKSTNKIRESINTLHENIKQDIQNIVNENPLASASELKDIIIKETSNKFHNNYNVNRVNLIANTTSNFALNSTQNEIIKEFNLNKVWLSQRDYKVRTEHRYADSQIADKSGMFYVGNEYLEYPTSGAIPENNINCRCYLIADKTLQELAKPESVIPASSSSADNLLDDTIIKEFAKKDDAIKYLTDTWNITLTNKEMNLQSLNLTIATLEKCFKYFGFKADRFKDINIEKGSKVYASANYLEININNKYFNQLDLTKKIYNAETKSYVIRKDDALIYGKDKYHPINTNIDDIIVHEYIHVITQQELNYKHNELYSDIQKIRKEYNKDVNTKYKKYVDNVLKYYKTDKTIDDYNNSGIEKAFKEYDDVFISEYAKKNVHEFTAESVSFALRNKGKNKYADETLAVLNKYKKQLLNYTDEYADEINEIKQLIFNYLYKRFRNGNN